MKLAALAAALATAWAADPGLIYSAAFPYQEYPKDLWPEELVRLKELGFNTVQVQPGRAGEVVELARAARRLGLQVWLDPPAAWPELEPFRAARGGPVLESPAERVARLADPGNYLFGVREAWAAGVKAVQCGAAGEEQAAVLARHGALVRNLGRLLGRVEPRPAPRWRWGEPPGAAPPRGLRLALLAAPGPRGPAFVSAWNTNADRAVTAGVLTVKDPKTGHPLAVRFVNLPPRQTLLMPLNLPLAAPEVCPTCSAFAPDERLVSASAELVSVTFENGVLALEFAAPGEGELVLELARQPQGPLVAGARLREFDWDEKTHLLRLRIPAGQAPEFRSRVGLGIELPDSSVFLKGPRRLLIGSTAAITAAFSSAELAARARLRAPAGWRVGAESRTSTEMEYRVEVPADAVPGDTATFAVEADGKVAQSLTLALAPFCSLRVEPEEGVHWRGGSVLRARPYLAATVLPRRRTYRLRLRNNADEIRTFELSAAGAGLEFQPSRVEAVVAGGLEREITVSAWPAQGRAGAYPWKLAVREGERTMEAAFLLAAVSPDETLEYEMDLDRDGAPEWVLENQKLRVAVSPGRGGRLLEFGLKGRDAWGRETGAPGGVVEAKRVGPGSIEAGGRRITLGPGDDFFEVEGAGDWAMEGTRGVQVAGAEGAGGRWRVRAGRVRVTLAPAR